MLLPVLLVFLICLSFLFLLNQAHTVTLACKNNLVVQMSSVYAWVFSSNAYFIMNLWKIRSISNAIKYALNGTYSEWTNR